MDFRTNKVVTNASGKKRFLPEGKAISYPLITGARPFLRCGQTPGICFVQKKIAGGGCTISYYTSFSPSILRSWLQKSTHDVCVLVPDPFPPRMRGKKSGTQLRGLYSNTSLPPFDLPLPEV